MESGSQVKCRASQSRGPALLMFSPVRLSATRYLCRGNSLCMTHAGMFGAGTRTRLLRRLHEHGIDRYGLRSWIFVSGEARFVSRGLPRTEGWNGAAAFDEGRWRRNVKWKPDRLQFDLQVKTTTRRSSGKAARQAAAFRGRAQRKSNLPAHMEQYMWNRGDADKSRFRA